jgi:predicted molibdopterin-dependent oxidoreductase YjgC
MYRRLPSAEAGGRLRLTVDGVAVELRPGETVAAALFLAGFKAGRTTPVTGAARGPYCMMGVCFDCLVEIDGEGNRQACMVVARDGMAVKRQMGARKLDGKVGT